MDMEVEEYLRPPELDLPPYPPKVVTLATGGKLIIRQASRSDVPILLEAVRPAIKVERDFYDVVAARVYAELLAYYAHRMQDEYVLVAQIDGELCAVVNGRMVNEDVGMSLHTLAMRRGLRIGAHAFAAKMEYHMDILGQKEVLVVAESPIGFRRWMIEYKLEKRFEVPHELGGVPSWALTRELFDAARSTLVVGRRPVPPEILDKAMEAILPPSDPPTPALDPLSATRSKYDPTATALMVERWAMEGGMQDA